MEPAWYVATAAALVAPASMDFATQIGLRYLRGSARGSISYVTAIAVAGVALGVAALLVVRSVTSGFQREFRDKVLGVNAHVLVMKYGVDFDEYPNVIARARAMPEVAGAGPFLIHDMMLVHGDRISTVLVKGVDPEGVIDVLDLPRQLTAGSLEGLRLEGAEPPPGMPFENGPRRTDDWTWLEDLARDGSQGFVGASSGDAGTAPVDAGVADADVDTGDGGAAQSAARLPSVLDPVADPLRGIDPERARRYIAGGGGALFGPDGRPVPEVRLGGPEREAPAPRRRAPIGLAALDAPSTGDGDLLRPDELEAMGVGEDEADLGLPDDASEERLLGGGDPNTPSPTPNAPPVPGMIVGATLARTLDLHVGDRVRLVAPLTGLGIAAQNVSRTPVSRDYHIIGIFEAGFQEYDSRLCYVDLYEAQHFYGQGDSVTGVEIRLHDLERADDVARRLERELGGPFHTLDWQELNRNLFTALEIQKLVLSLVISVILVVASIMVIVTLIMTVLEKKKEIAILKAMGATDVGILRIFVVQGTVVGLVGTVLGLLLGGGIVYYLAANPMALDPKVYLIDHVPVVIRPWEFIATVVTALAICGGATLLPSLAAARMLPVDGLRQD